MDEGRGSGAVAEGRLAQGRSMTIAAIVGVFAALLGGIYAVLIRPLKRELADILRRLAGIETKLEDHSTRITRLEEERRVVEITVGRRGGKMVRFGRRRASIREMPRR